MRKVEVVTVPNWGTRDDGKLFRITEKDAIAAEKWAMRMFIAIKGTGGQMPEGVQQLGMVGIAITGINAFLAAPVSYAEIEPLLDDLLACVSIVRHPQRPDIAQPLMPDDIEEPRTVAWLRSEVLRVHTGFSFADGLSSLLSSIRMPSADTSQST